MKRYKRLFEERVPTVYGPTIPTEFLTESTLVPKEEVFEIFQLLIKNKKDIFSKKNKDQKLCSQLSQILAKYKISFKYDALAKNTIFITGGIYVQTNDTIYLTCSSRINSINETEKHFYDFLDSFKPGIGHELLHRMQLIQRKHHILFGGTIDKNDLIKQLSSNQEIMAYAWQAVEELRNRFGNDKEILEHIKKYDLMFFRHSTVLSTYYSLFEKDDPILKKFYKYMYLYLEDKNETV